MHLQTAYEISTRDWSSDVCSSDLKKIRDFYAGFGGESAYWKNMKPVIRQNLAVRKYIDSQTGTQTEEEIKQEAYESGVKQTDLDAFEQVVEDVCEEIGDYLKTLQKSDASVDRKSVV